MSIHIVLHDGTIEEILSNSPKFHEYCKVIGLNYTKQSNCLGSLSDNDQISQFFCASCYTELEYTTHSYICQNCTLVHKIIKIWSIPRGRGKPLPEFESSHFNGKISYMLIMWKHFNRFPNKLLPDYNLDGQLYDAYTSSFILSMSLQIFSNYKLLPFSNDTDKQINIFDSCSYKFSTYEQNLLLGVYSSLKTTDIQLIKKASIHVYTPYYEHTLWTKNFIRKITDLDLHNIFLMISKYRDQVEIIPSETNLHTNQLEIKFIQEHFPIDDHTKGFDYVDTNHQQSFTTPIPGHITPIPLRTHNTDQSYDHQLPNSPIPMATTPISFFASDNDKTHGILLNSPTQIANTPIQSITHHTDQVQNYGNQISTTIKQNENNNDQIMFSQIKKKFDFDFDALYNVFNNDNQNNIDNDDIDLSHIENSWTLNDFIYHMIQKKTYRFINRRIQNCFEELLGNLTCFNYIGLKKFVMMLTPEKIKCPNIACTYIKFKLIKMV